jgi:hypothetical protein
METNSKNGGLPPSALALKNSLNQKPDTSQGPMMLTPYQLELLRQGEIEIDEYIEQSPLLKAFLQRLKLSAKQDFSEAPLPDPV